VGKYGLPNPYLCPRATPHQAPLKPELPLKQTYPGFNASPEMLQAFEPWLFLLEAAFLVSLSSDWDTYLLHPALFQPLLILSRIETPVGGYYPQSLPKQALVSLYSRLKQVGISRIPLEHRIGGYDVSVGLRL